MWIKNLLTVFPKGSQHHRLWLDATPRRFREWWEYLVLLHKGDSTLFRVTPNKATLTTLGYFWTPCLLVLTTTIHSNPIGSWLRGAKKGEKIKSIPQKKTPLKTSKGPRLKPGLKGTMPRPYCTPPSYCTPLQKKNVWCGEATQKNLASFTKDFLPPTLCPPP